MSALFRRRASLTVAVPIGATLGTEYGDIIEITGLRFRFEVKKNLGKEPNTAKIQITNLSEQSRAALQDKSLRVTLSAGYESTRPDGSTDSTVAQIFVGDARDVDSVQEGADWETTLQCGDGERGYRHGRVSKSFKKGTLVTDVIKTLATGLGAAFDGATHIVGLRGNQYVSGYAVHGRAARELDRLLSGYGFTWSIQDGKLQVVKPETATEESVVVLDAESGLVGTPALSTPDKRKKTPVLTATSLLQPAIGPGRRVQIDSTSGIRGVFKVTEVEHVGDTAGGDWYSRLEGTPT